MTEAELKETTKRTAAKLFHTLKGAPGSRRGRNSTGTWPGRAVDVLHGQALRARGHLPDAARAVCGGLADRPASAPRAARSRPRRPQRREPRGRRWPRSSSSRSPMAACRWWSTPSMCSRRCSWSGVSGQDWSPLAAMIDAARAAGEVALRYYRGGFDVTLKADQTPVTQADREAEQIIMERLGRAFPGLWLPGRGVWRLGAKDRRFIIDPIDGTKNFVRGIPVAGHAPRPGGRGARSRRVSSTPRRSARRSGRTGVAARFATDRVSPSPALPSSRRPSSSIPRCGPVRQAGYWERFATLVDATDAPAGLRRLYGLHPGRGG